MHNNKKRLNCSKGAFTLAQGFRRTGYFATNSSAAFTMAEFLITLGIIGVVAAITLPTMITNYQKKVTVSRLKQTYTQLQQAIKLSANENNIDFYSLEEWQDDPLVIINKYLLPHLKQVNKVYSSHGYIDPMCFDNKSFKPVNSSGEKVTQYIDLNKSVIANPPFAGNTASFSFKDNICVGLTPTSNKSSGRLFIDITGSNKGPNILGKDLFIFAFQENNVLLPAGDLNGNPNQGWGACSLNTNRMPGYYCAIKIFKDGWKIRKDYPW